MTDTDVSIRFGGDTTQLKAALADAKSGMLAFSTSVAPASANLQAFSATMKDAQSTSESWLPALLGVTAAVGILAVSAKTTGGDIKAMASSVLAMDIATAKAAVSATAWYVAQSEAGLKVSDSILGISAAASAFASYTDGSAYAERGARLFAVANDGIIPSIKRAIQSVQDYGNAVRLSYSGTAKDELSGISDSGGLDKFISALKGSTGAKDALTGFTAELEKIPGLSDEAAQKIEVMLATIPNYSTQANTIFVNLLQSISSTGDEAVVNAKKITDAFGDTKNGGKFLGDLTSQLKNLDDIQILATHITATLQPGQASSYIDTIIAKLKQQADLQKTIVDQNVAALNRLGPIGNLLKLTIQDQIDKEKEFAAAVNVATLNLGLQKAAADKIAEAQQKEVDFQKMLNDETTKTSQLDQAQQDIVSLKSRQTQKTDDGDDIKPQIGKELDLYVRTLIGEAGNQGADGMAAVAAVIKNRVDSAFDGMKTYRDVIMEGNGKQFNTWSPGNQAGKMANSVSDDSTIYKQALAIISAQSLDGYKDPTKGATSFYNPSTSTNAFPMSNKTQVGDQTFGNTPGSPPVVDAEGQEKIVELLQKKNDEVKEYNDAIAGGNATEVASLQIAQQNVTAKKDEVADAEKLVEAAKKEVDATANGSADKRLAAEKALASAETALVEKKAAVTKAAYDVEAQSAEVNSRAKLKIELDALNAEQAMYAAGSAKYLEIQKQKLVATKTVTDVEKADAAAAEDAKFDAVQKASKESEAAVQDQVKNGELSHAQELASLKVILDEEANVERAHYTTLMGIWGEGTQQYRKALEQRTEVDAKAHQQEIAAARAANQAIEAEYKSSFERIGSTIASSLTSIIEKTGTWRQLMQNVAKQILSYFVDAGVKMVADWAAHQAATVATTVLGEAAKTTAVATGTAARETLSISGLAASAAATIASVLKSITASAAETFAGIFGFLSPVLGPAAAGPAAAGSAAVLGAAAGIGSYAVGSWSLGSDQLANVHRGEMIVPAAATPWAQSLMANAAGGGGGGSGGGDTHNWTVNATDPQSFIAQLKNVNSPLAKMIGEAMRRNPSLRGDY